jgi:hypothetical protein
MRAKTPEATLFETAAALEDDELPLLVEDGLDGVAVALRVVVDEVTVALVLLLGRVPLRAAQISAGSAANARFLLVLVNRRVGGEGHTL